MRLVLKNELINNFLLKDIFEQQIILGRNVHFLRFMVLCRTLTRYFFKQLTTSQR
jgi:hypothetical protein